MHSNSEDVSDFDDQILNDHSKKYEPMISSKDVTQIWLVEQYQNLGSKVILQLDEKSMSSAGSLTVLGSIFRSIVMNLLRNAEHGKTELKNCRKWLRKNFPDSRILKWNQLQFNKTYKSNDSIVLKDEHKFFMEKLSDQILGVSFNQNPVATVKRKLLKRLCKFESLESREDLKADLSSKSVTGDVPLDLSQLKTYNIPTFSLKLFEKIKLWRDIGLIHEYPEEVALHIIIKFITMAESNLLVSDKNVDNQYSQIVCTSKEGDRIIKITRNDIIMASLVIKYLKKEIENKLPCSIMEHLKQAKCIINQTINQSIVNLLYVKKESDLVNVLKRYYDDTRNNRTGTKKRNPDIMNNIEEAIDLLICAISGVPWMQSSKRPFLPIEHWVITQTVKMKRLWNFNPFERKIKQLIEAPDTYGNIFL